MPPSGWGAAGEDAPDLAQAAHPGRVARTRARPQFANPHPGSGDADGNRASQLKHAVERVDSHVHLGRPARLCLHGSADALGPVISPYCYGKQTYSGRPNSIIRFSALTVITTSLARR
jgi:hypothetical protein